MGVEAIATRTTGSFGVQKKNLRPVANENVQIDADEYNRVADAVIELQTLIGTDDEPGEASLEARVAALEADDAGDDTAIAAAQTTANSATTAAAAAQTTANTATTAAAAAQSTANTAVTAAAAAQSRADDHDTWHIRGGADEIQADLLKIGLVPDGYTRTTDGTATNAEHLRAHLNGINAKLKLLAPQLLPRLAYTASHTLALVDAAAVCVAMNSASDLVVTVPRVADVGFEVGTVIPVFHQGAGALSFAAGHADAHIHSLDDLVASAGRYAFLSLWMFDTNEWLLSGQLA